ncbi:MAG: hypothetical protein HY644_05660 [Acidobacteria bacterium]|nr:hypothetical protein [Acidobacteriota bacterium]
MRYWDLGLIAASSALLMGWLLGRIKNDLPHQIRALNGIRLFLAVLPLSLYTVVLFMYQLSFLFGKPLKATTGQITILISILGLSSLLLICAVFVGLTLLHALWTHIEQALRSRQLRESTDAVLRMQISLGQSKAGLLANVILLALLPIPLMLLRFRRQLFTYFPREVDWQNGTWFYILTMLILATALYGLRRHYELWVKERELYRRLS